MKHLLFQPITIGKVTFKNRVMMSPMCMYSNDKEDGTLDSKRYDHYVARAFGGVGGILVESTAVVPNAGISIKDLGLYNDEQEASLKKLVDAVHLYGTKIGIQLSHAGRKGQGYKPLFSSSAHPPFDKGYEPAQEADHDYLDMLVTAFGEAAQRAERAGFDFVEIHGAHGYFISQFLSPLVNKRTDEYGGSLANRYRFLQRVITAVKQSCNLDIHFRISANEIAEGGNTLQDIIQILKWAQDDGIVFFDISSGGITPDLVPNTFPGYQAVLSRKITEAGLPCSAVGYLGNPELAEYILQSGDAKMIYQGRALLKDPFWVEHARARLEQEVNFPINVYTRGDFY